MTTPLSERDARRQLRLDETAAISAADVKRAYRAAAKLHHPDAGDDPNPTEFAKAADAAKLLAAGRPAVRGPRQDEWVDLADALRQSFDEFAASMKRSGIGHVTVARDWARNELRISSVPTGATVIVEPANSASVRIVDEYGQPITVRSDPPPSRTEGL